MKPQRKKQLKLRHRFALVLLALSFPVIGSAVAADAGKHRWKQLNGTQVVTLWKAKAPVIELATLTPGCDVHDWACVADAGRKP